MRLDAPEAIQAEASARLCQECGDPFTPKRGFDSFFCCTECRKAFNNRRMQRGAEFYDLYMAFRYERPLARALNVLAAMNRLASIFRREDNDRRAGRKSWAPPRTVLERHPAIITRPLGDTR